MEKGRIPLDAPFKTWGAPQVPKIIPEKEEPKKKFEIIEVDQAPDAESEPSSP